jgi:hypothetical protein
VIHQVIALSMASRALCATSLVQSQISLVFGMATQAGNVVCDPGCVVKIMAEMTTAAGAIHGR